MRKEIEKILKYCLEHNHVGHEYNDEWVCAIFKEKKCDCIWGEYEEMITAKFLTLLSKAEYRGAMRVVDVIREASDEHQCCDNQFCHYPAAFDKAIETAQAEVDKLKKGL